MENVSSLEGELRTRLEQLDQAGLRRQLRRVDSPQGTRIWVENQVLLNFSSNDYLGLANHSALKEAAATAAEQFGAGSGASRLICGSLAPHHALEETLAAFKKTEAALVFSSGYVAAVGTIGALVGRGDIVILDKRVHACLVDAARLSGATLRVFKHNDMEDLNTILEWADRQRGPRLKGGGLGASAVGWGSSRVQVLVITESLFSMDGDQAPLRALVDLKDKHGAWLMLDEAHATGVYGAHGRGLADQNGVQDRIDVQMGTLGKALGSAGGFICGSRFLIDYLVNCARTFIFSTAPSPAAVGAACAGLKLAQSGEGDRRRELLGKRMRGLGGLIERVSSRRHHRPEPAAASPSNQSRRTDPGLNRMSAICPWILGAESRAMEAAALLRAEGIFVPAIRFPTVSRGAARLRFTVTAAHTTEDLAGLDCALERLLNKWICRP